MLNFAHWSEAHYFRLKCSHSRFRNVLTNFFINKTYVQDLWKSIKPLWSRILRIITPDFNNKQINKWLTDPKLLLLKMIQLHVKVHVTCNWEMWPLNTWANIKWLSSYFTTNIAFIQCMYCLCSVYPPYDVVMKPRGGI